MYIEIVSIQQRGCLTSSKSSAGAKRNKVLSGNCYGFYYSVLHVFVCVHVCVCVYVFKSLAHLIFLPSIDSEDFFEDPSVNGVSYPPNHSSTSVVFRCKY